MNSAANLYMPTITESHNAGHFSPSEMLDLARSGRVYALEQGQAYPYLILTQKAFDLSAECAVWRINAMGQKDELTKKGPIMTKVGGLHELDLADTKLRQDYMDNARERMFITLFEHEGMLATGIGRTEQLASRDAAIRVGKRVLARQDEAQVVGLRLLQKALLKGDAIAVEKRQAKGPQELDSTHTFITDETHRAFEMLSRLDLQHPSDISAQSCSQAFEAALLGTGFPKSQLIWVDFVDLAMMLPKQAPKQAPKTEQVMAAASPRVSPPSEQPVKAAAGIDAGLAPAAPVRVSRSVRFGANAQKQGAKPVATIAPARAILPQPKPQSDPNPPGHGLQEQESAPRPSRTYPRSMRYG